MSGDGDDSVPGADEYYVRRNSGQVLGPFDPGAIEMMLDAGKLQADVDVSPDRDEWYSLEDLPELDVSPRSTPEELSPGETGRLPVEHDGRPGSGEEDRPGGAGADEKTGVDSQFESTRGGTSRSVEEDQPRPAEGKGDSDLPRAVGGETDESSGESGRAARPEDSKHATREYDEVDLQSRVERHLQSGGDDSDTESEEVDLPTSAADDDGRSEPRPDSGSDPPGESDSGHLPTPADGEAGESHGGGESETADERVGLPARPASEEPDPEPDSDLPTPSEEASGSDRSGESLRLGGGDSPGAFEESAGVDRSRESESSEEPSGDNGDDLFEAESDGGASGLDLFSEGEDVGSGGPGTRGEGEEPLDVQPEDDDFFEADGEDDDLFEADGEDDDLFEADGEDDDLFGDDSSMTSRRSADRESDTDDEPRAAQGGGDDDLFESVSEGGAAGDSDLVGGPDEGPLLGGSEETTGDDAVSDAGSEIDSSDEAPDEELELEEDPASEPARDSGSTADVGPGRGATNQGEGRGADRARPASPEAAREESDGVDRASGASRSWSLPVLGTIAVLALVVGGGGFMLYRSYLVRETEQTDEKREKTVRTDVSLEASKLLSDSYDEMVSLIDRGRSGSLRGADRGKLLLAESLFLARYDDPEILSDAEAIAEEIRPAEGPYRRLGRGVWAAVQNGPQHGARILEPLTGSAEESDGARTGRPLRYFAELGIGIGRTLALEGRERGGPESEGDRPEGLPSAPSDLDAPSGEAGEAASEQKAGSGPASTAESSSDRTDLADRARQPLERAGRLREESGAPFYWLGRVEESIGADAEALAAYRRAVDRQSDHVPARVRSAAVHYRRGELGRAREQTEKILTQLGSVAAPSETAEAYHVTGQIHLARAQISDAIEYLKKALRKSPRRTETLRLLARTFERAGKYQKALHFFTSNKELTETNPEVMLGIARSHIGLQNWKKAVAKLEEGEESHPDDGRFSYYLGELHLERGALDRAREAMKRAVERDPRRLDAWAALARLTWRIDEEADRAESYIRKIVERPEEISAPVAVEIAEHYRQRSRFELAEQWFREALERNPNSWPARLKLAELHLRTRTPKKAVEVLREAKKTGVEDPRLFARLADAHRQTGEYDRAIEAINAALKVDSENARFVFVRGQIQFDRGNYESARRDFNDAYEYDPEFHRAYYYLGRTAFEQGNVEQTLRILRHVLDYKPRVGEYRYWMGRALETRDRPEAALRQYRKASELDPDYSRENPELFIRRGRLLVTLGRAGEGKRDIERALEIAPDLRAARLALGDADFETEDYESAIEHFERALAEEPDRARAQYRLGMSLVYTDQPRSGAEHLQLAVEYGYEDPEVFQTLGYLYKKLGRRRQAIEAFESFLRDMPEEKLSASTRREILTQIEHLGG